MNKIVLPGGSGFLGRTLTNYLSPRGWDVVILSRRDATVPGARVLPWSHARQECEGATVVFNLGGRSVNCRYHQANRDEILRSRVDSTRAVAAAIGACQAPPALWINASTATIYRHAEDRPMDEATGELGHGFSVDVARAWERAFDESSTPRTRKIALRLGIGLDRTPGGTLDYFRALARCGFGASLGPGTQYVSWLHGEDLGRAIEWLAAREDLSGVFNCTTPYPTRNEEFMRVIREACGVPFGIPTAKWMLEIGAWVLGTETELILKSRRVVPQRMLEEGFVFHFPEWRIAARHLLR